MMRRKSNAAWILTKGSPYQEEREGSMAFI